jgi:hypothetical protein
MNDETRGSTEGFTRVRKRRNQRICHAGLSRKRDGDFRYDGVMVLHGPVDECTGRDTGSTDQPNVGMQEAGRREWLSSIESLKFPDGTRVCEGRWAEERQFPVDAPNLCFSHTGMKLQSRN